MPTLAAGCTLLLAAVAGDAYVVSADQLVINGTPIRLAGIDAPAPGSDAGQAARDALAAMIDGQTVLCRVGPRRRHQTTRSGVCYIGEEDLGAGLVRAGLVLDCPTTSQGRYDGLEPLDSRDRLHQRDTCRAV